MLSKNNRLIGAILFVSGTTIGAGMLALPVTTGLAGFFPSLLIMVSIWLFMMLTAFYFLEVNLRIKEESNLISMVRKTLGRKWEWAAWIVYLLLLYSLTAAYLLGCSQILDEFFRSTLSIEISGWIGPVAVFLFFALFVYLGTQGADLLNRVMMAGLGVAYISLLILGLPRVNGDMLFHVNWNYVLPSISVVLTTFGYHIIIPTLSTYLEHDSKRLRAAIFFGSLIPFVIYLLWQCLVMGIVPVEGEKSLLEASHKGLQITFYLKSLLASRWVGFTVASFAFFAIVTSLIGVSLSLADFLADGLKIKKNHQGKFLLVLLTFIPPLVFALFYPTGYIVALRYAGIFVALLLALLPAIMAWQERYSLKSKGLLIPSSFKVPGGKPALIGTFALSLIMLGIEIFL